MNGLFPFESQADFPPMIVDSFAGGGGASTGIEMALGRSPDIAINHNPAALALHAANHPDTLHLSENVWQVDPLDYVKGRRVGLAWFSPDCKHFSKAKGGKPVERNIRDLAWVVVLWAERVRPDVILLENVEEFRDWGPLREEERGGKVVLMPDPDKRGATFAKWAKQLRKLGYRLEHRELRACDYGAPTIRKRLFLVARCDGQKIVWPKPTHGRPDDPDVIAGRRKPWRTAAEIIDWSLPCPSIFDTSDEVFARHGLRAVRPLASATMSRVARGVKRYVLDAKRPFLVDVAHGEVSPSGVKRWGQGHRSIDDPLSVVTAGGINHAVIAPSVIRHNSGATGHDMREPLATVTAGGAGLSLVAPFVTKYYGAEQESGHDEPLHTATSKARFGHVESDLHLEPLTDAQLDRAREVAAFLRGHGFWDEREFVTVEIDGEFWTIVDIGMRMLTPRELFSAQGFPPDYVIDVEHDGRPLSKSDQIACCGNSVCPPLAAALVAANCAHLAAYREAAE